MTWELNFAFRRRQNTHLPSTFLTVAAPFTIQYVCRNCVKVFAMPQCPPFRCWSSMIKRVTWWSLGKIMGCFLENASCAWQMRPPTRSMPSTSTGFNLSSRPPLWVSRELVMNNEISSKNEHHCTALTISTAEVSKSSTVRLTALWRVRFLLRRIDFNRRIHAMAYLRRSHDEKRAKRSAKYVWLTVTVDWLWLEFVG